ncbi:MAG TPA: autotransporter domain-containing protein [Terrimicrobiaceae bacterium]
MTVLGPKSQHPNTTIHSCEKLLVVHATSLAAGTLFFALLLVVADTNAQPVDSFWKQIPDSVDWNTDGNWVSESGGATRAPVKDTDTATFTGDSRITSPSLSSNASVKSITFAPGAVSFSIRTNGKTLGFDGAGIINNSGRDQTISNDGESSRAFFNGSNATADNVSILNSGPGSEANFGNASAANARITNRGDSSRATFFGTASAGNATIENDGLASSVFFDTTSSAGNATIINSGTGSDTNFAAEATAENATIKNSREKSFTAFRHHSSGGKSSLINANATAFITIAQLSSGGTTAGSVEGDGTIFLGSKNLEVGETNKSTTFSGVISDGESSDLPDNRKNETPQPDKGGSLTKVGTGTLTLTGENTYTGGTFIEQGALQLGNGGATGSIIKNVANNGILVFNRSNSFTFDGVISGTGSVQQNGMGTTVLVGNNTYTGLTTINAGTLQLGNGGTTGSIAGNVVNNGILAFNRSGSFTFGGAISGAGSVLLSGPGTTVLTGNNTYSGGTVIAAGSILAQNSSALGTGPVAFGNGTTLQVQDILDVGGDWTVPGKATVSGGTVQALEDFSLVGGGTLIANSNFNVPGAASIDSSDLVVNNEFTVGGDIDLNGNSEAIVNGVLASPMVNVNDNSSLIVNNPGAVAGSVSVAQSAQLELFGTIKGNVANAGFFQGTGVVKGNVVNSGTVSPGTSPGTLTVNGNYTQNAGGTLRIEVAGRSPGQFDLLAVSGRANLAGNLQLVRVGGFKLRVGDRIAFLTADGGVSGAFDNVENDFATGTVLKGEPVFLPNAVVLELTQGSFVEFAVTPNEVAVATALDSAVGDPGASELMEFLNNEPLENLRTDFNLISPDELSSIYVTAISLANVQTSNLGRRMSDIRAGSAGFSAAGFAIKGNGPSFGEGFAGVSGPEGKSGPAVFAPGADNRWGVFATGVGEFTNVDSTFNSSGYDLETGGFTVGVDYRIGSNFAIGLMGGYAYTGVGSVNDGSIQVNGGKLGLYATAFGSGFYLDAAVSGGLNGYDTRRTALEGAASGSTEGGELNVLVAGGYDWKVGGLTVGPTANFQYTYVGFDGFTEGGSLAPLKYPDQHAYSARTAFGMKASYDWKLGPVRVIPEVRTSWQHEYGTTAYPILANFASGAGNSFTVYGPEIGRDSLLLSAGFAIQWNERISTYAYYDGELFRTNYLSNNVSAGFRLTF